MFKIKKNTIKILFLVFCIALLHLIPTGVSEYRENFYLAGASTIDPPKAKDCKASIQWEKNEVKPSTYNLIVENLTEKTYDEWELTFYKEKQILLPNLEETTDSWVLKENIALKPHEPLSIPITMEITSPQEEKFKYINFYFEEFVFLSSCDTKED